MCCGSPTVTGFLTHCESRMSAALFKNPPPRLGLHTLFLSVRAENKAVNLCLEAEREGERSSKPKMWRRAGPPTEQVSLVLGAVPDCAEQAGAPWCPPHIPPDGVLLSAEGTEVHCSQWFPAAYSQLFHSNVSSWAPLFRENQLFIAQSKSRDDRSNT